MARYAFVVLLLLSSATTSWCWDTSEMQMFDLVEEIKGSFYDFLNVSSTASSGEIRRAYRKLSLIHHPDKNVDNPEANKMFQRIVAVYEILRDAKLREKYDDVLKNGLPTWRQPVFYYRKLRKMGLAETLLLVFLISIIGHYFVMWGHYLERKLNMEDFLSSAYKRNKAKRKQKDVVENAIQEELNTIPRPKIIDIWPIALVRGIYYFVTNFPSIFRDLKNLVMEPINAHLEEKKRIKEEEEELKRLEEDRELKKELKKKRKKEKAEQIRTGMIPVAGDAPVVYNSVSFAPGSEEKEEIKTGPWTDADYVALTNAMVRFPPGVPERWQRIAERIGRSVEEATAKAKAMRENGGMPMSENVQNSLDVQGNLLNGRVDGGITLRESAFEVVENEVCGSSSEEEEEYESARHRRQAKRRKKRQAPPQVEMEISAEVEEAAPKQEEEEKATKTEVVFPDSVYNWSQEEQRKLEAALRKFPKGTHERWERIAAHVQPRTKLECMDRFRYLSSVMKAKSQ